MTSDSYHGRNGRGKCKGTSKNERKTPIDLPVQIVDETLAWSYSPELGVLGFFSWALVQEQLDLVELLLRDGRQVGSSCFGL
jgi:hypothetical protein